MTYRDAYFEPPYSNMPNNPLISRSWYEIFIILFFFSCRLSSLTYEMFSWLARARLHALCAHIRVLCVCGQRSIDLSTEIQNRFSLKGWFIFIFCFLYALAGMDVGDEEMLCFIISQNVQHFKLKWMVWHLDVC